MILALVFIVLCLLYILLIPNFATQPYDLNFNVEKNIDKNKCETTLTYCLDDCNYLCKETGYICSKNICMKTIPNVPCNEENGGIVALVNAPNVGKYWECICQYPQIFSGPRCETRNPEFCREGTIIPPNECLCDHETKLTIANFVYCEKLPQFQNFKPAEFDL